MYTRSRPATQAGTPARMDTRAPSHDPPPRTGQSAHGLRVPHWPHPGGGIRGTAPHNTQQPATATNTPMGHKTCGAELPCNVWA
eukprot:9333546-Alexandrium_andersonii.AAC.1